MSAKITPSSTHQNQPSIINIPHSQQPPKEAPTLYSINPSTQLTPASPLTKPIKISNSKPRDLSLDLLKGLLTIFMVTAHIFMFFPVNSLTNFYGTLAGLIVFPGFMFAFGYSMYLAYVARPLSNARLRQKLTKNFLRTILAAYIIAIAYAVITQHDLSPLTLLKILCFHRITGFCEFLPSFAFLYIIIYFTRKYFRTLPNSTLLALILCSLLMSFFLYHLVKLPILSFFVGFSLRTSFPIAQFFCFFLFGLLMAKHKLTLNSRVFNLCTISFTIFVLYLMRNLTLPAQFPPSLPWLLGGFLPVYLLYIICKNTTNCPFLKKIIRIGQNTLSYLVISNLIIFLTSYYLAEQKILLSPTAALLLDLFLCIISLVLPYCFNCFIKFFKCRLKNRHSVEPIFR